MTVRVRDGFQDYLLDRHPFDVVGWDGYVWPYTFNADDFEPRAGRFHLPPPAHQTFQGQNFVICTFAPRMLDWDPQAVTLPYHHSNIQSEEVMFYADGDYAARKGVDVGMITLHPSGSRTGRSRARSRSSLGAKRTDELAVMWDTFRPLRLTLLAGHRQARVRSPGTSPRAPSNDPGWRRGVRGGAALLAGHEGDEGVGYRPPRRRPPRRQRPRLPRTPQRRSPRRRSTGSRGQPAPTIDYTEAEQEVWRTVCRELARSTSATRAAPSATLAGARPAARPHPAARRGQRAGSSR